MILKEDPEVGKTLSSQKFSLKCIISVKNMVIQTEKMYIALVDEKLAGCVALTKNDDDYCEIKRLYIREEFRGNHLGNMLSEKIIEDAGAIGYKYMRLDTVPFMSSAIKIYEKVGFKFIEKYNVNPASNAIFMQLDL